MFSLALTYPHSVFHFFTWWYSPFPILPLPCRADSQYCCSLCSWQVWPASRLGLPASYRPLWTGAAYSRLCALECPHHRTVSTARSKLKKEERTEARALTLFYYTHSTGKHTHPYLLPRFSLPGWGTVHLVTGLQDGRFEFFALFL